MEALRRLGMDQAERPDAISQRESSSGVQIVAHRAEQRATAERQDEVIGACVGDSRRYPWIERLHRKAEQRQGFCNQFVVGRAAAGWGATQGRQLTSFPDGDLLR